MLRKKFKSIRIPTFSWASFYNLYFILVVGRTFNTCLRDHLVNVKSIEHDLLKQKVRQQQLRDEIINLADGYPEFSSIQLFDDSGRPNIEHPVTKEFYQGVKSWSTKKGLWHKTSSTSGSSGVSLTIIRSPKSFLNNQIALFCFFAQFGVSRFDKNIYIGGARNANVSLKNRLISWASSKITGTHKLVASDMVCDRQFEDFIKLYESLKPLYLQGFSSALLRVADYIKRKNISLHWKPKLVHPSAEGISSNQREILQEVFNAPVSMVYGSAECCMASECEYGVMHVHMNSCQLDTKSDGSAILTVFESDYMPMVNYQMGDIIEIETPTSACACGKHTTVISKIIGRLNDQINLPSGRVLTHPDLNMLIQQIDNARSISEYQVLHFAGTSAVEIRVSANNEFDSQEFVRLLTDRFTDVEFSCSFDSFKLLANGKKPVMLTVNEVPNIRGTYKSYKPYSEISESQFKQNDLDVMKLDWNESTADFPIKLKERALAELSSQPFNIYPDLQVLKLRSAISDWLEIPPKCLTIFNGSDSGIATICRLFLEDTDSVVTIEPTYGNYKAIASRYTKHITPYELIYPFVINFNDFSKFLEQNDHKLVFFTNPNNPTGVEYPRESIFFIAERFPKTCFVIDEAYVEFGDNSLTVGDIPSNVIILRTFSKAFGLAGIRLGYSISGEELAGKISLSKDNKEVDTFAQITGTLAVRYPEYMYEYVRAVGRGRQVLTNFFDERQVKYLAGKGNFILFKVADPVDLEKKLKSQNIFIRNRTEVKNLDGYLRVTLGEEALMTKFSVVLSRYI